MRSDRERLSDILEAIAKIEQHVSSDMVTSKLISTLSGQPSKRTSRHLKAPSRPSSARTVRIPKVDLTLDLLVMAIRQREPATRSEIAKALVETELDARLAELIGSLGSGPSADDITDADILAEVNAVRQHL
jgi:hypothetical protein